GRLDISAHPFCGGTPDDVRITTRYDDDDFARALMGVLHETGHALYQRGLPVEWRLQPVGRARGMAMHESQSLLLEMQVCRSRAFLTYAAPIIRKAFGDDGPEWEVEALYRRQIRGRRDVPGPMQAIAEGEFAPLLGWARGRVHSNGSLLSTAELVETATGQPLGAASFERHLRDRYLS